MYRDVREVVLTELCQHQDQAACFAMSSRDYEGCVAQPQHPSGDIGFAASRL